MEDSVRNEDVTPAEDARLEGEEQREGPVSQADSWGSMEKEHLEKDPKMQWVLEHMAKLFGEGHKKAAAENKKMEARMAAENKEMEARMAAENKEMEARLANTLKGEVDRAIEAILGPEIERLVEEALAGTLEELKNIPSRVTELEGKVVVIETDRDKTQNLPLNVIDFDARLEVLEKVAKTTLYLMDIMDQRQTEQEGRARRGNLRIKAVREDEDEPAGGAIPLAETILEKALGFEAPLHVDRAHRQLGGPRGDRARDIVVKLDSERRQEEVIKAAWSHKGGVRWKNYKIYLDRDLASGTLRGQQIYDEARDVLRAKGDKGYPRGNGFRAIYKPTQERRGEEKVDYRDIYTLTADMKKRGYDIAIMEPPKNLTERLERLTWRVVGKRTGKKGRLQAATYNG